MGEGRSLERIRCSIAMVQNYAASKFGAILSTTSQAISVNLPIQKLSLKSPQPSGILQT